MRIKVRAIRLLDKINEEEFVEIKINENNELELSKKTIELSSLVNIGSEEQTIMAGSYHATREELEKKLKGDYFREAIGKATTKGRNLDKCTLYVYAEHPKFFWKGDPGTWAVKGKVTVYHLKKPDKKKDLSYFVTISMTSYQKPYIFVIITK